MEAPVRHGGDCPQAGRPGSTARSGRAHARAHPEAQRVVDGDGLARQLGPARAQHADVAQELVHRAVLAVLDLQTVSGCLSLVPLRSQM